MVHRELTGFAGMNNPLRILETLDSHLSAPSEITIFGRAALALGFQNSPAAFARTRDVDAILSLPWLEAADENVDFWLAQQQTNAELETEDLYLTHLFREEQIILTPDWLVKRVSLQFTFHHLRVFRPATLDLILTKMMRGDENDLADIRFLLSQEQIAAAQLVEAFSVARVPDMPEIRELFERAQPKVLGLANSISKQQ